MAATGLVPVEPRLTTRRQSSLHGDKPRGGDDFSLPRIWLPVTSPRGQAPWCRSSCRIAHGHIEFTASSSLGLSCRRSKGSVHFCEARRNIDTEPVQQVRGCLGSDCI